MQIWHIHCTAVCTLTQKLFQSLFYEYHYKLFFPHVIPGKLSWIIVKMANDLELKKLNKDKLPNIALEKILPQCTHCCLMYFGWSSTSKQWNSNSASLLLCYQCLTAFSNALSRRRDSLRSAWPGGLVHIHKCSACSDPWIDTECWGEIN